MRKNAVEEYVEASRVERERLCGRVLGEDGSTSKVFEWRG